MSTFTIKRGDTSPAIRYALEPSDITLLGASVRFQMRLEKKDTVIDSPAIIVSELPPVVQYIWQNGDTDTAGKYEAEFKVTYPDGSIETFPNDGFIDVFLNRNVPDLS
jgi:Rib/alpha/Esp surface antigen-like repeat protein